MTTLFILIKLDYGNLILLFNQSSHFSIFRFDLGLGYFFLMSTEEEIDWSQERSTYTVSSMLTNLQKADGRINQYSIRPGDVEYIYVDEERRSGGRKMSDRLCYNTGFMYFAGLTTGGAWGAIEGLRHIRAEESFKLRLNTFLNCVTKRGPLVGNSVAGATMSYTLISHALYKLRGNQEDLEGDVVAAGLTGALFKATSGMASSVKTGLVFSGIAFLSAVAYNTLRNQPTFSSPKIYGH
jgi:inner membrane translocase subunit Tim23